MNKAIVDLAVHISGLDMPDGLTFEETAQRLHLLSNCSLDEARDRLRKSLAWSSVVSLTAFNAMCDLGIVEDSAYQHGKELAEGLASSINGISLAMRAAIANGIAEGIRLGPIRFREPRCAGRRRHSRKVKRSG